MKKIIFISLCFLSFSAFAQKDLVEFYQPVALRFETTIKAGN